MREAAWLLGLVPVVAGCQPPPALTPLEPLPVRQAIEPVNENAARLSTGLKATGSVRGQVVVADGRKHRFDLSGKLLVIPPRHLRFDVQNALGHTEFLLGSNADTFWLHVGRDDDTFRFGRYATPDEERTVDLPIRPDWMIEALGLNALPADTTGVNGPVQIIERERQRLLFISYDSEGQGRIRKEHWLSRYEPRLIERVVFRDQIGTGLMHSELSEYRRSQQTGPMLPHRIRVDWPAQESWLEFDVRRWQMRGDITADQPAFQLPAPEALRERYRRVIDIDSDSGHVPGPTVPQGAEESP